MGTKREPGKYDCMNAAEPDEPIFVLLGRDPEAAATVRQWSHLRRARKSFSLKADEALLVADAMDEYCKNRASRIAETSSPASTRQVENAIIQRPTIRVDGDEWSAVLHLRIGTVTGGAINCGKDMCRIMEIAGVGDWGDLLNCPVRVIHDNVTVIAVGHFLKDLWLPAAGYNKLDKPE